MDKPKTALPPIDTFVKGIFKQLRLTNFVKKPPLVLVNGVAEQYESWYFNVTSLSEHFVVHWPNFYLFKEDNYLKELSKVSVDWVVDRVKNYLDSYITTPPYYLVASSSGCQTTATLASKYPELVSKLVMICPSGLGGDENLPVIEGVTKRDLSGMISAIFHDKKNFAIDEIVQILKERFENKKWRFGFVRMAQVTKKNNILEHLTKLNCPVLFLCGEEDQIIPIWQAYRAAQMMRDAGRDLWMIVIPKCGHAPQIERAQTTNRYIRKFWNGSLFKKTEKHRFWRDESGLLIPFDLDKAAKKALSKAGRLETVVA